jgi:hypothetical protein
MLQKLKLVYNRISNENGWTKYSTIDLQFKDQVICVKGNSLYKVADTTALVDSLNQAVAIDSLKNNKNNVQTLIPVNRKL